MAPQSPSREDLFGPWWDALTSEQRQELRTITEGRLPIWARTSLADAGIRPTASDADIFYWYLPDDVRALIALAPLTSLEPRAG